MSPPPGLGVENGAPGLLVSAFIACDSGPLPHWSVPCFPRVQRGAPKKYGGAVGKTPGLSKAAEAARLAGSPQPGQRASRGLPTSAPAVLLGNPAYASAVGAGGTRGRRPALGKVLL